MTKPALRVGQAWKTREGNKVTLTCHYKSSNYGDLFIGDDGYHYWSDGIARGVMNSYCSVLVELIAQDRYGSA